MKPLWAQKRARAAMATKRRKPVAKARMPAHVASVVSALINQTPDAERERFEIERVTSDPAVQKEAFGTLKFWRDGR